MAATKSTAIKAASKAESKKLKSSPVKPVETAKKTKATTPKIAPPKAKEEKEVMYTLPLEVSDWIERAHSTINHLRGEVERLKSENRDLKEYQKWAARRITSPD